MFPSVPGAVEQRCFAGSVHSKELCCLLWFGEGNHVFLSGKGHKCKYVAAAINDDLGLHHSILRLRQTLLGDSLTKMPDL